MKAEVHSAVEAAHRGVLWKPVREILKTILVAVVENASTRIICTFLQFLEHKQLRKIKRDTLKTVLVQSFEKGPLLDTFSRAITSHIASSQKFIEQAAELVIKRAMTAIENEFSAKTHGRPRLESLLGQFQ